MKKSIVLGLAVLISSTFAAAQSTETIFTVKDTKDGEEVIDVQYRTVEPSFELDSFAEADANGDGCLDKSEAHDKGILNFEKHALANKSCLNEEEYLKAMYSAE